MKIWFQNLNENERRLIKIGGLLVLMALLWVMVYLPVTDHISNQMAIKDRLEKQVQQMQALTGSIENTSLNTVISIPAGVTFSTWVDQELRGVNLQDMVNRTEPIDENSMTVWLQNAPFDQVIDWLQNISQQYAIQVDQIDVNVVDSDLGLTNIRMRLVK